ncbi:fasciclin domain-containing protein [Acuticoccus sp. MNP-M23]|uniref:fasciclin domain-containing protein n=1 Tax=Acuticoccus sp. MNP-M23 TaxID=3072793 RepID=UPI0028168C11|nr:fasciclin domain-containing protein [Acuticoccus sp. MNP-M23]WMS41896.1 fasciclin domain-containing protein [Acuticoccus sp. MNP-M23]
MIRQFKWLAVLCGLVAAPVHAADVAATLESDARFSVFAEAFRQATESRAERDAPMTVFAPSDEAFSRLPQNFRDALLAPRNAGALERVVGLHVVPGNAYRSTNIPVELTSASGTRIVVTYTRGALTLRPAPDETTRDPDAVLAARAANEGRIVSGDIVADNALIHLLDAVLLPPGLDELDAGAVAGAADEPPTSAPPQPIQTAEEADEANTFVAEIAQSDADGAGVDTIAAPAVPAPAEPASAESEGRVTVLPAETDEAAEGEDTGPVVTLPPADEPADRETASTDNTAANVTIIPAAPETGTSEVATVEPNAVVVAAADVEPAEPAAATPETDALALTRPVIAVSDLLGRDVEDDTGEKVGEVEDVLLSLETGRAETIILSIDGGLLDLFGETVEVRTRAISIDPLGKTVIVDRNALNLDSE